MKRYLMACVSFALTVAVAKNSFAQEPDSPDDPPLGRVTDVEPAGELAEVDTSKTREVRQQLQARETRDAAIREITGNPAEFAPPALYAAASAMFAEGKKADSLFWFYLGQLRARSDANKCNDVSARQAVSVLNQRYGAPINQFAFQDTGNLRRVVAEVLEYDRTHARQYDPRWISLHGLGAFTGKAEPFTEEAKWNEIDQATRDTYKQQFEEAMLEFAKIKEQQ